MICADTARTSARSSARLPLNAGSGSGVLHLRRCVIVSLMLALAGSTSSAQDMKPPRIIAVSPDWRAALATIGVDVPPSEELGQVAALAKLNAAVPKRIAGVALSPVPVLLPIDTEALLRDQAAGTVAEAGHPYLSGFHARTFLYAGPSGYDAALAIRTADVAELADITFADPIEVQITGSRLVYELDAEPDAGGGPMPELDDAFPGIRRTLLEHYVRYTFERYRVPYVVSVNCFDASVSRYKLPTCRAADRVITRFLRALRLAGGTPPPERAIAPLALARPPQQSADFTFHAPGRLVPGTSSRGRGGRADSTVYSQIRFPIATAPAYANSQLYRVRRPADQATSNYDYPWRDNFCERRGFTVGQCPAGIGHQGQDIRPARCEQQPCQRSHDLVAVRDGAVLRAFKQEAAYIVVNTEQEHIRFRYLHMNPRKMDEDGVLNGRLVREGEVIGQVSNYSRKEGGTSYHLHFDVQVPTRRGWVFVNPYMTLVAAYERLIGGRGTQIEEPVPIAGSDAGETVKVASAHRRPSIKRLRHGKQIAQKSKLSKKSKLAARTKGGAKARHTKKRRHVRTARR